MENILKNLDRHLEEQLDRWPSCRKAFNNLRRIKTRVISSSGLRLQFNPARIISTTAGIDPSEIAARRCFLCAKNRPKEQQAADLGDGYDLLVNPYPILREHFCVVSRKHRPQAIRDCYEKMVQIAGKLKPEYIIFYNGPVSGASAPDHLHMQIGSADNIPLVDILRGSEPPAAMSL